MKASLLAMTLALALATGVAAAQAADMSSTSQDAAQPQTTPWTATTAQPSFQAFKANINPTFVVPTTGGDGYYDEEDQFVGPHGYPLGGWKEVGNPPS